MDTSIDFASRDNTIAAIRSGLKNLTGQTWSVTGGKGTAWGWITVASPPKRKNGYSMTTEDTATLAHIFGENVSHQGVSIPDSPAYREHYTALATGLASPTVKPSPYWD